MINNDIGKAERWLKSWARVNTTKGDRRLIDVARAMRRKEIVRLLEEYEHINEFVCATLACDLRRMKNIIALGKGRCGGGGRGRCGGKVVIEGRWKERGMTRCSFIY